VDVTSINQSINTFITRHWYRGMCYSVDYAETKKNVLRDKCPVPGIKRGRSRLSSTNQAQCRLTLLIKTNELPLRQTTSFTAVCTVK